MPQPLEELGQPFPVRLRDLRRHILVGVELQRAGAQIGAKLPLPNRLDGEAEGELCLLQHIFQIRLREGVSVVVAFAKRFDLTL